MENRPSIPIELKRKVLTEAGHRCSIPTCRFPTTEIAHIIPWATVKEHTYMNLIALCPNCHTRYDKGEIDKESMMIYKQKLMFISDKFSHFEINVLDHLSNKNHALINGELLIKDLIDEQLVEIDEVYTSITYDDNSEDLNTFSVRLTSKGHEFIRQWYDVKDKSIMY